MNGEGEPSQEEVEAESDGYVYTILSGCSILVLPMEIGKYIDLTDGYETTPLLKTVDRVRSLEGAINLKTKSCEEPHVRSKILLLNSLTLNVEVGHRPQIIQCSRSPDSKKDSRPSSLF